jgi:CRISPR-associated protein Cmr6
MPEKPILKSKPQRPGANEPTQSAPIQPKALPQKPTPPKQPLSINIGDAKDVPLMFQAQIKDRGNIQYVGDENSKPKYEQWLEQWHAGYSSKTAPVTEAAEVKMEDWQKKLQTLNAKPPVVESDIRTWCYTIRWRMVTNGGQDGEVIRPVIGAMGMPFFPGSSMKGAFRRACPDDKLLQRYCGTPKGEKPIRPGILRFHGGYPIDIDWSRLIDVAHGQQPYQVMQSNKEGNANVQISLYKPKLWFGISSSQPLEEKEWAEIEQIWQRALGRGIGSRVSAGYGYVNEVKPEEERVLLSVHLNGEGLMSQLLETKKYRKISEFRPNMFKAALRGHTLRLLGGITDKNSAKTLTRQIWGGIPERDETGSTVVGCVGIHFTGEGKESNEKHTFSPTYTLKNGKLDLLKTGDVSQKLTIFLEKLIQFSLLLGGFGKSWRRVHHVKFFADYFKNNDKAMIGCHWAFAKASQDLYIAQNGNLDEVTAFISQLTDAVLEWAEEFIDLNRGSYATGWREAWHPSKVQVWGRTARNGQSVAVRWFHDEAILKGTDLAGKMGQIGRIWHRMYPVKDGYIELLTIFSDGSKKSNNFLDFLRDESEFTLIWGDEHTP